MRRLAAILLALLLAAAAWGATYYVTQAGAGAHNGSLGGEWSIAEYNASATPGAGDTVVFTGTITTTVVPATNGSAVSRLTLDFSAATIPSMTLTGRSYLTLGGGTIATMASGSCFDFGTGSVVHDVTIQNWTHTGGATNSGIFIEGYYGYAIVAQNNTVDNTRFYASDSTLSHDLTMSNNYCRTSLDVTNQIDIVFLGDAYNVTIEGNEFIQRTVGAVSVRHNDILQCYKKGGGNAGNPYGWVIRYNWFELNVASGSGDTSWFMLEAMKDNGATPALQIYSNVFVGRSGTASNNGCSISGFESGSSAYLYNNTFYLAGSTPENTIRFLNSGTLYAKNNICYAASAPGTGLDWDWTEGDDWNRNFFYQWSGAGATQAGANGSTVTDPLFVNAGADDFSLQAASVCRDSGEDLGAEYDDGIAYGATWPNPTLIDRDATWGCGAYEHSETPPAIGGFLIGG